MRLTGRELTLRSLRRSLLNTNWRGLQLEGRSRACRRDRRSVLRLGSLALLGGRVSVDGSSGVEGGFRRVGAEACEAGRVRGRLETKLGEVEI